MSVSCADVVEILTSKLNSAGFEFDDTDDLGQVMDALHRIHWKPYQPAPDEEIRLARERYGSEFIQIDDDAGASGTEGESGVWVQAWVYV